MKRVIVVGAGFAGLAVATDLAEAGYDVKVIDKNSMAGGRAQIWQKDGFSFDMGPSWYWMPEVFENYFEKYGYKVSDFYELTRLSPSYRVVFGKGDYEDIPANLNEYYAWAESKEVGAGLRLKAFLKQAQYKYEVGMKEFVWKPSLSIFEFFKAKLIFQALKIDLLTPLSKHIRKFFTDPKLIKILEFPVLFLGSTPQKTPALYSLMNYADISLGTWYPAGGMWSVVQAMYEVAVNKGVEFQFDTQAEKVITENQKAVGVKTQKGNIDADYVVMACDYQFADSQLLKGFSNYNEDYWDSRKMAPSALMFYIGLNKKLINVEHHTLFFDEDFDQHAKDIYQTPKWPSKPLFYVSVHSKTDKGAAPEGHEAVVILMPLAPDLEDNEATRERYFDLILDRMEDLTEQNIREAIVLKRSFAVNDFKTEYNSFKGNAYGLANTLMQTAFLKPQILNKKLKNVMYCGQLTTPGPGVPPSIISGLVVANYIKKLNG